MLHMYVQYAHTRPSHACSPGSRRLVQAWAPCLVSPGERTHQSARAVSLSPLLCHMYTHTNTHTHIFSLCHSLFLSLSPLVVRPLDIRRCPGHVIPLRLPSRLWHRFSREEEDGKGEEGRRRKKTEQESSAKCDYRRLAESFGFTSLLRRTSFRLPPARRISFSFFHFLPRLPSGCSYVHVL